MGGYHTDVSPLPGDHVAAAGVHGFISDLRAAVLYEAPAQHSRRRTLEWGSHNATSSFTVLRVPLLASNELGLFLQTCMTNLPGIAGTWV